jgi:hypothetical protein
MKNQEVKYINGVPVARMQDYGYRDFSILHKIWKVISNIIVYIVVFLIYLSVIIIAIKSFNADSRSKKKLATTWETYSLSGPRIIDLSLEDAALFTIKFYQNLINKTKDADLDTCVAEFYLEKAGRGGSAKKGIPHTNGHIIAH